MKSNYELNLERHRALDASRKVQRQESEAQGWRDRVLSPDEKAEYERLQAAPKRLPSSLGHRAALPASLMLDIWAAVIVYLLSPLMITNAPSLFPNQGTLAVVILVVMVGGLIPVFVVLRRRSRVAFARHQAACSLAMHQYLVRINYEDRLREAAQEASEAAWDPSEVRRRFTKTSGQSNRDSRYGGRR
jgi:hypothetical protein